MIYYTYAWLREDRTPYYIGKGSNGRAWRKGSPPKDRVLILKKNLTEQEAFKHEKYMIAVFGRKDIGTGILHNFTDGGDGISGHIHSEETRQKLSKVGRGRSTPDKTKQKLSEVQKGNKKFNNGVIQVRAKACPEGFVPGMLDENKQKLSEAAKRRALTDEGRQTLSKARKGKPHSDEAKQKLSKTNKGRKQYCNAITGQVKRFHEPPDETWVPWQTIK
jgi:hypothetical protein